MFIVRGQQKRSPQGKSHQNRERRAANPINRITNGRSSKFYHHSWRFGASMAIFSLLVCWIMDRPWRSLKINTPWESHYLIQSASTIYQPFGWCTRRSRRPTRTSPSLTPATTFLLPRSAWSFSPRVRRSRPSWRSEGRFNRGNFSMSFGLKKNLRCVLRFPILKTVG